jgi:vacuolar-type H+-ATPase subunit I/STV1
MKINDWRDPDGRFARRSRVKKNRRIVLALVVITVVGILGYKSNWTNVEPIQVSDKVEVSDLTPEQQDKLQKQYELAKQETILNNKKDKLDAEYKTQSDAIEAQLEQIRSEKMSFQ